jgi:hypothetical protein
LWHPCVPQDHGKESNRHLCYWKYSTMNNSRRTKALLRCQKNAKNRVFWFCRIAHVASQGLIHPHLSYLLCFLPLSMGENSPRWKLNMLAPIIIKISDLVNS